MLFRISNLMLLTAALLVVGCQKGNDDNYQTVSQADAADAEKTSKDAANAHHHEAPHGGELIELGDHEYNVEMVLGDDRSLTAYVLGAHASKNVAIGQESLVFDIESEDGDEVEVKMAAEPQEGDADGKSSRFVAKGDAVPDSLKSLEGVHGHVHINIGGKEYLGNLDHEGHDDDHGDDDHKDGDDDHAKEHKDGDEDADHKDEHKDGDKDDDHKSEAKEKSEGDKKESAEKTESEEDSKK